MAIAAKSLAVLSVVLAPVAAHGATVTGTVQGPDGMPFRGAFVQAQNAATKVLVSVLSDKTGRYRIDNLPAGQYRLQIRAVGYRAQPKDSVSLSADQMLTQTFALAKDAVHWTDLSQYQGSVLFPAAQGAEVLKGKDILVGRC